MFRDERFVDGIRLGLGPAAAVFVVGAWFGAAAGAAGWSLGLSITFSALAFSASAQFALLTTLATGTVLSAVIAAVLINARYVVMSVALNDSLRGGRLWRAVQAQALADVSFAVAHRGGGRFDVIRLVGATVPQWGCWVAGTTVGLLGSPSPHLMRVLGMDVVFPAFFLLLALHEVRRSRRAMAGAIVGGGIASVLLFVTNPGNALLGATATALIGALPSHAPPDDQEVES
jgi:predicted branched-subunit amino acid permease